MIPLLEKLQIHPSQKAVLITTFISMVALLVVWAVVNPYLIATTAAGAPSAVDFELTWGVARAQEILGIWSLEGLETGQITLTIIGFVLMPTYAFFLSGGTLWTARQLPKSKLKTFGISAALFPFGVWVCDFVENMNLLQMFGNNVSDPIAMTASVAGTIKFMLLALSIGAAAGYLIKLVTIKYHSKVP